MAIIPIKDDAHWHELRSKHIGGSEISALLGVSSYMSKWQLFMEKSGKLSPEDLSQNRAVQAGTFLEAGIANWAAATWDMKISKVNDYYTVDDVPGMGASLDYITDTGEPVEIKFSTRGHGWTLDGDEIAEAPAEYILQVQHQLACCGASAGWLIAMVHNEPRRMLIERREGIVGAIRKEIASFWSDVAAGKEPEPDFKMDEDAILRLVEQAPYADITLDDDALFCQFKEARETAKLAAQKADELRAELLLKAQKAMADSNANVDKAFITCGDHKMTITKVAANPGREVTEEMVGTFIGARKGYQQVRVS